MQSLKKRQKWNKLQSFSEETWKSNDIYSSKEFKELINYERVRADRNGSVFSIILFTSDLLYSSKKKVNIFVEEVKTLVRVIDHIGWYDKKHVAILLPDTAEKGALILGKKILEQIPIIKQDHNSFDIYTYPDKWLKNKDASSGYKNEGCSDKKIDVSACTEDMFTMKIPVWKKAMDVSVTFIMLLVLSPLFAAVSLYIKIVSPGPVFFTQTRIGYKGRPFKFYKFRSMKHDNNQSFHGKHAQTFIKNGDVPMEKLDDKDPRIIPGGQFFRKSCIDELPQLLNVLFGDMSLVGPRPCIPYEADEYLRWHTHRFDTVPGMTGLWQVSGKNKLTFKEMIRLDISYAKNMSLLNDLRIIIRTPVVILGMMFESVASKFGSNKIPEGINYSLQHRKVQ